MQIMVSSLKDGSRLKVSIGTLTLLLFVLAFFQSVIRSQGLITNTTSRNVTSLSGEWNYIVDPYQMGYLNFHQEVYDKTNPSSRSAFYNNCKPKNKQELVEYDFDKSPGKKYELVWSDEFNYDGKPDPKKWGYETGFIRNHESQYYTGRKENVRVENGSLIIESLREKIKNKDFRSFTDKNWRFNREYSEYSSASVTTQNLAEWTYGKIEVRAKLPKGIGSWPAVWMLGQNIDEVGWPKSGEIDIMEHVGYDPDVIHGTVHTESYNHVKGTQKGKKIRVENVRDDYHVYSIEWTALNGIESALRKSGYFYMATSHFHRDDLLEQNPQMLIDRQVDGIIAVDTQIRFKTDLPVVTVAGHEEIDGITNVVLNHQIAAELGIGHLFELGHRQIALIKGQDFSTDTAVRWETILEAARKRDIVIDRALITQLEGDIGTPEIGYIAAKKILEGGKTFTALFAFNDVSAIGAIRALQEAGLRIPEDVSVLGFDDIYAAEFHNPALTTIRQPLFEMGELAGKILLEALSRTDTHGEKSQTLTVEPQLIIRQSTASVSRSLA